MIIIERYQQFADLLEKGAPSIYSNHHKRFLFLCFLYHRIIHGTYLIDYIQYRFYERNRRGRKRFIEYQRLHKIMKQCNSTATDDFFDNKELFNHTFQNYLGRAWFSTKDSSFEDFRNFIRVHKQVFVKPIVGSFGQGVRLIDYQFSEAELEKLFKEFTKTTVILEEVIVADEKLAMFNPSSLNTLRIVTMLDQKNTPHVMTGVLRLGRAGKIADNFHHKGIAAQIDIHTGIVSTTGVDRDLGRHVIHPDSKITICGFSIPYWDDILTFAKKLALVVPQTRYVGWDIAITNNGQIICIEGNRGADPDVTQTTDQIGKYDRFAALI